MMHVPTVRTMISENDKTPPVKPDERLICEVCGRFGAIEFGERRLCLECYEGCGSCCPEFGREESAEEAEEL